MGPTVVIAYEGFGDILLEQETPSVDIQLGVEAGQATNGMYEVCVTATVTTKIKDRTVFLVECSLLLARISPGGRD